MAPTAYRIELASTGRAGCQNKWCKDQGIKIGKGEFRFGVWVEIPDGHASWKWRHWGCITPQVLANVKDSTDGDMELMDGYEEMPEDWQKKFLAAVQAGHVPDEDWRGDPEFNRPGMKGFKRKTPKKKAGEDDTEERAEQESPIKGKGKKRVKKAADEDEEAEAPAKKKSKKAAKKSEDDADLPAAAPKKASKKSAVKAEEETEDVAPQKKSKKSAVKVEEEEIEDVAPKKKSNKAAKKAVEDNEDAAPQKKAKKTSTKAEADDEADDQPAAPAKKAKTTKVKAEEDVDAEVPQKKGRKPKAAATAANDDKTAEPAALNAKATKGRRKKAA